MKWTKLDGKFACVVSPREFDPSITLKLFPIARKSINVADSDMLSPSDVCLV